MLKEVVCEHFRLKKIVFKEGLNVVLGDDGAKNSIGKSTMLMLVDFVQGGDSFLKDDAGVINHYGHHFYNFSFQFSGDRYYFSRSTDVPDLIYVCDSNYVRLSELPIESYREQLKSLYGVTGVSLSYRSIVSPFSRIWRKGCLDPDQPFSSVLKEPAAPGIDRLVDLFGYTESIAVEKDAADALRDRKKLLQKSMDADFVPSIGAKQYKANKKVISDADLEIERLKQGFAGALNVYESLFDQRLRSIQQRKNDLVSLQGEIQGKISRLQREISGVTPRLAANIALVTEFFPNVDVERLEQVEAFHRKIGSILKKEIGVELESARAQDADISGEVRRLEAEVQAALQSKGLPDDLFSVVFGLKEISDKAVAENKFFELKRGVDEAVKLSGERLSAIYAKIFSDIQSKINAKLHSFNKVVYGPLRSSSELNIKTASSFVFSSGDDTGTGKSYAGLIGFDFAMLALTALPFVIHDSVIYKNIEVAATRRIVRILSVIRRKQVFLALDEAQKFGVKTEKILRDRAVVCLSNSDLLYDDDWRDKSLNGVN
jgi:uncharacterized protein YydD (DUF2326 family)